MSAPSAGPGHQHDPSTLITAPASTTGAAASWPDYRQRACGDRVPAAMTGLSSPVPTPRLELQALHVPTTGPQPEAGR